ncbi:hypothetical protein A4O59_004291 [Salmonella enterica subsp. enterica]|nr:hypothetical protein [Salmonella enterica subsp. enterica]
MPPIFEFWPPVLQLKSQISRSAPPLLHPSKILTDIFHTVHTLTHCKTKNHVSAGCASSALANSILSCDRYSNFEQD